MIIREIKKNPDEVLKDFDYFNDYKDTKNWCEYTFPEILPRLKKGFDAWLVEHNKNINANLRNYP